MLKVFVMQSTLEVLAIVSIGMVLGLVEQILGGEVVCRLPRVVLSQQEAVC